MVGHRSASFTHTFTHSPRGNLMMFWGKNLKFFLEKSKRITGGKTSIFFKKCSLWLVFRIQPQRHLMGFPRLPHINVDFFSFVPVSFTPEQLSVRSCLQVLSEIS
ncbi:hypothetical protein PHYPO_G00164740 [Pangasianodon hypophthalmus]|uniref:Uncharacterized protein n=1 Tax=Pangasianodon hypophthalmus TaxID=310915 RepID=A0A5N5JGN9_PANHP|nr:hypothetical protein PHYPO_G00164740 [Pangasianodon hypophthalmus]